MNKLTFTEFNSNSQQHSVKFRELMHLYSKELDGHKGEATSGDIVDKWVDSIIKMIGEENRYLVLCCNNEQIIGFAYGKIDKPYHRGYKKIGYGYIMEFFVLPEFRRNGYGRQMFYHLEKLFERDGASRMYLTADGVTGKPFWQSLGFEFTGEISSENKQEIYEKEIIVINNIQIKILKYPDDKILSDITKRHGDNANEIVLCLTDTISSAHYKSDFFCIIAVDDLENVIGCANFFQSSVELQKWFYTDLWVDTCYRRKGIAKKIIKSGLDYLSQTEAQLLKCTVEPNNIASINLQKSIGFKETMLVPFEDFDITGQIMFEINIEQNFNIVELTDRYDYLIFVCDLLKNANNIPDNEYKKLYKATRESLIVNSDSKQNNYIIRKGIVPIGLLKIDTSNYKDELPKTILMIHSKYKNIGIEKFVSKHLEQCKLI